jgi:hypothetical protein
MPPHDDTSWVRCLGCGAETGWQADGEGAITAWNTRTTQTDPRDEVIKWLMGALDWYADDSSSQGDIARTARAAAKAVQP